MQARKQVMARERKRSTADQAPSLSRPRPTPTKQLPMILTGWAMFQPGAIVQVRPDSSLAFCAAYELRHSMTAHTKQALRPPCVSRATAKLRVGKCGTGATHYQRMPRAR